jgi:hypothetical protein
MHSMLTSLPTDDRDAVNTAMVRALDEIERVLARRASDGASR